jgi:hypothetical protein
LSQINKYTNKQTNNKLFMGEVEMGRGEEKREVRISKEKQW